MVSVIDTSVLFGRVKKDDAFHEAATELVGTIDGGGTEPVHVTDYVLGETMNLVQQRIGHDTAIDLLNTIQDSIGMEIVRTSAEDFENTELIFRQEPDLSFVDAAIVAHANRIEATHVYSFDEGFDSDGLGLDRCEAVPE